MSITQHKAIGGWSLQNHRLNVDRYSVLPEPRFIDRFYQTDIILYIGMISAHSRLLMKKLVIVHRELSNLNTGGRYYLAHSISYFVKKKINMEVVDFAQLPKRIRGNRLLLVIYVLKHYLKYRKGIFHFTNHNLYFYLLIPYFLNRIRGNKYGCGCHLTQYNLRKNFFMKWIEFLCEYLFLQGASLIIIPSEAAIQQFRIFHLEKKKRITINPAPNIVNDDKPIFRKHMQTLVFAGHVVWRKGLDILIKAMACLRDLDLHLEVAGSFNPNSSYGRQIRTMINNYGLNRNIKFHGCLAPDELALLYKKADLFVFPSRHETYGMVLVEAMSFGLPIVASAIPTTLEIVRDNINGVLYETEDSNVLAGAIRQLASTPDLRRTIAQNNIRISQKIRTWEDVGLENLMAITEFLKERN